MSRNQLEFRFQCLLVKHIDARIMPGVYYTALPFGEYRTKATAGRLKRMGVKAGPGDLQFLHRSRAYMLELKIWPNDQSEVQRQFEADWCAAGGFYAVAFTLDEALTILENLGLIRPDVSARAAA